MTKFPLKVSADGRYLVDAANVPFFIHADTAWRMPQRLSVAEARYYLDTRRAQGFNAVHIWVHGGDDNPGDAAGAVTALAEAIRAIAPHHLHTYHALPEHSSADWFGDCEWLDVNMAYTYKWAYEQVAREYERAGRRRPIFLGETGYEGEANTGFEFTPYLVRRQAYWALLSGACGHAYGSKSFWDFTAGWQFTLHKLGAAQMRHVQALFASRRWWTLRPDVDHTLVTAGYGTFGKDDYVSAALAEDHSFVLIYMLSPRAITVDLAQLAHAPVWAWWVNPRDGSPYDPHGCEHVERTSTTFTPPAEGSEDDWILVLQ